ncbi:AAA family ATPase [Angustibacter sp. McL0619]|uniref:AAA family ATPase n=1 Tax=Angustibacter sp. McL0619 TaxID=3415676 RepID=UPI003CE93A19
MPMMADGPTHAAIVGRERETALVAAILPPVPSRLDIVVLVGPVGIGKTTIAGLAADQARSLGVRVLSVRCSEHESGLAFAALHQLLRPALPHLDSLPEPQGTAVRIAFGLHHQESAPDVLMLCLGALTLLSRLADDDSLLVLVDDAQWLDDGSRGVLSFIARRLEGEPVSMLIAARGAAAPPGLDRDVTLVELGPLSPADAERLLDLQPYVPADTLRARILERAAGNPLGVVELAKAADEVDPQPITGQRDELRLTDHLERTFAGSWQALPEATRWAVLVAATADSTEVWLASDTGATADQTWLPAEEAGLVVVRPGSIEFRHPLVRSAIYRAAPAALRRQAHLAVAARLEGAPDRQVWHRAAAATSPDEEVAAALEAAASRSEDRGGAIESLALYERAGQLSPDPADQCRRLAKAAFVAFLAGRMQQADDLAARASAGTTDPAALAWVSLLGGAAAYLRLQPTRGAAILLPLTGSGIDSSLAANALTALSHIAYCWARPEPLEQVATAFEQVATAFEQLGRIPEEALQAALYVRAALDPVSAHDEVADMLGTALASDAALDQADATVLGGAALLIDETEQILQALAQIGDPFFTEAWDSYYAMSIVDLAWGLFDSGRWSQAGANVAALAHSGSSSPAPTLAQVRALTITAVLAAQRGQTELARSHAATVLAAVEAEQVLSVAVRATWAAALANLADGELETCLQGLRGLFDLDGRPLHHESYYAIADLASTAIRTGYEDDVRPLLALAEEHLLGVASPRLQLLVHRAAAVLATDPAQAEARFAAALDSTSARWPFERAQSQLAYGEWLRRNRRTPQARTELRAALATFERLGATPWTERARGELRASGIHVQPSRPTLLDQLTAQQQQIVRLAAEGLTNREIGERLFLSRRTIGFHLHQAFPKLGVTSRTQLRDLIDREAG